MRRLIPPRRPQLNNASRLIPPLSRDQWFIYFSQMTWGFSAGLWLHLQPLYVRSLGADPKEVGATLSLAGLLVIFVYVPVSILADRWRRKPIIVSAWVMGTVATLLIGLAPDWRWVIPALALNLLSSFSRPAVAAHVAATDVSDNPSRTFAFLWTGFAMGNIISPSLGGWIAEVWGLRTVFFVATGVSTVSTLIMWQLADESAPLKVAAPQSGEREAQTAFAPKPRGGLRQVLGDRPFLWQMALMLSIVFALELGTVFAPNYLQDVKGLSLRDIGQLGTVASLGMFTLTLVLGYMRNDRRKPLVLNQVLVLCGLLCLLFAPGGVIFHPLLLAGYFFRGGSRAVVPLTRGRVSGWLPPEALNVGFGLVDTAAQTATLLAPLAAGFLYDQHPSWPLIGGVVTLIVTMSATLATRTVRSVVPIPGPSPVAEKAHRENDATATGEG